MDSGWNNARLPFQEVKLSLKDSNFVIKYKQLRDGQFEFSDSVKASVYDWQDNFIDVEILASRLRSKIYFEDNLLLIHTYRGDLLFKVLPKFEVKDSGIIEGGLNAPMPGKVVEVQIKKGSSVKKGDTLIILEAMKMEHKVSAPSSGKIKDILVSKGEQVENGQTLVVLD
jgi:propionyl-CoA carboxylase alpha chain